MSSHTPGPWRAIVSEGYNVQGEEGAIHSVHAPDGGYIAIVECGDDEGGDEAAANAHLIAASPDLLEAAEDIDELPHPDWCPGAIGKTCVCAKVRIGKAIAKARGEA